MGPFFGKGRTPGESSWKASTLAQYSPPKLSCSANLSILRNSNLKSGNRVILAYFGGQFNVTLNLLPKWANITQFLDFKFEFLKIDKFAEHESLGGEYCSNMEAFHELSPGVRPFPKKGPNYWNYAFFRILPMFRGRYVGRGDRQVKNKFHQLNYSRYCLLEKKGALIPLLPVKQAKITEKFGRGWWFIITTLKCLKKNWRGTFLQTMLNVQKRDH